MTELNTYRVEVGMDQDELRTYLVNAPTERDARELVITRIESMIDVQVNDADSVGVIREYDDVITWEPPDEHV